MKGLIMKQITRFLILVLMFGSVVSGAEEQKQSLERSAVTCELKVALPGQKEAILVPMIEEKVLVPVGFASALAGRADLAGVSFLALASNPEKVGDALVVKTMVSLYKQTGQNSTTQETQMGMLFLTTSQPEASITKSEVRSEGYDKITSKGYSIHCKIAETKQ